MAGFRVRSYFEGENGWVQATWTDGGNYSQGLTASSENILGAEVKADGRPLPTREDKEDFIHAILTGEPVMIDAEIGHRTCSMGQLAHISIQRGKRLSWDPEKERFAGDEEANTLLERSIRGNWMKTGTA